MGKVTQTMIDQGYFEYCRTTTEPLPKDKWLKQKVAGVLEQLVSEGQIERSRDNKGKTVYGRSWRN